MDRVISCESTLRVYNRMVRCMFKLTYTQE